MENEQGTEDRRRFGNVFAGARIRTYVQQGVLPPRIGVIGYGAGNIQSICNALSVLGADAGPVDEPSAAEALDGMVLPGVGAFPAAMQHLRHSGMADALRRAVIEKGIPMLGICLGMQLLSESSDEFEPTEGLGLVRGRTTRMACATLPLPHVGWNNVEILGENPMYAGIPQDTHFYFDHSYAVSPDEPSANGVAVYDMPFAASLCDGHVWGTQFHPEKSQLWGLKLLRNFLDFVVRTRDAC
jgi:glutamine amidotransferase